MTTLIGVLGMLLLAGLYVGLALADRGRRGCGGCALRDASGGCGVGPGTDACSEGGEADADGAPGMGDGGHHDPRPGGARGWTNETDGGWRP